MKRWPLHKAYFWESSPFFRLLLPLIAGILFYSSVGDRILSITIALSFIGVSFLLYILFSFLKIARSIVATLNFLLVNLLLFFTAWSLCYINDIRNSDRWFGKKVGITEAYLARVVDDPAEKEKTWKLRVTVLNSLQAHNITNTKGDAFIYVYKNNKPLSFHKGDTVLVPDKWKAIKNPGNPFEFNYALYCSRNNLFYQQFLSEADIHLYTKANPTDLSIIDRSHDWCMRQLATYIPDAESKGLIQAMLLGDEINLDEHLLQAYSETGIVHIIAISGGNVTIFFLAISYLLWWIRNKKYLWVKYLVALPLVWFYVVMAGAPPSAVRAAAMFSILAMGLALQKNNNSLNQLFATAVILLIAEPGWLFSVGFQLSFIAVLSLVLFYKPIYKLLAPANIFTKNLWATASASIAAEILVAPLVIYYFHLFPLLFLVANIAAFLFMGIVLITGMFVIAISFIPFAAKFFGFLLSWLVAVFNKIVYQLQDLNPLSFHFLRLSGIELALIYIGIGGLMVFMLKKNKGALFTGLSFSCLLLILFCHGEWIALHQKKLVVYNIAKINHIELIDGKYYSVLNTDTGIAENKKNYILKPAHTSWAAWRSKNVQTNEIFLIGDKKILLLNEFNISNGHFPVDYLLINCPAKQINMRQLQDIFTPTAIILGNNNPRLIIDKCFENCKENNIPLHTLMYDGAFVKDAF